MDVKHRVPAVVCMHEFFFNFFSFFFLTKSLQVGDENGPETTQAKKEPKAMAYIWPRRFFHRSTVP